ncbi:MAG TPA: RNA polymerase subunit sigma-70 [Planctomycetaceae bacterium]|nr:RNA polymerase subunit sigma-70 [Planctomycetaceae bacterium]
MYAYVFSLVGEHARAADIVQETNLVLWRQRNEFEHDRGFIPWAIGIARMQVLANLRDRKRDRLLLDAELAEQVSAEAEGQLEHYETLQNALRTCLKSLDETKRKLIDLRYHQAFQIADIAEINGATDSSVKVALLRIRRQLAACVRRRMSTGELES